MLKRVRRASRAIVTVVMAAFMVFFPFTVALAAGNGTTNGTSNSTAGSTSQIKGSVLTIGWTTEPDSLSPFVAYDESSAELMGLIYDPLVAFDNHNNPTPRLAKSWTVSKNQLTWTFHLRHDVKWQDGVPFTSADVVWTYNTEIKSQLGLYASFENGITSVKADGPYTVVITTSKPKANMLQMTTPILPKHIWDKVNFKNLDKWPNADPIGTGPFKFVAWKKGQYIQFQANKNYFLGAPKVDNIIYQLFANSSTMAQALKVGEIDAAIGINEDYYKQMKTVKNVNVIAPSDFGFTELAFNSWTSKKSHGNPLLLNTKLRQAIAYAINKQAIINVAYSGLGTPGTSIIPPSMGPWHWQPPAGVLRTYDVAKANQMLNALGFTKRLPDGTRENAKGQKLSFRLLARSAAPEEVKAASMIKDMLQQVGIKITIQDVDDGTLNDKIYNGANYDMFIWGWVSDVDPTTLLSVLTTSQIGNLSDSYFSNKQYDALVAQEQTTLNTAARQKLVWEAEQIAYKDLPYLVLLNTTTVQAVRTDKFTGWKPVEGTYFEGFNNWNYMHVEPISAAAKSGASNSSTGSSNKTVIIGIVVVVIVVLGGVLYMRSRKRNSEDED